MQHWSQTSCRPDQVLTWLRSTATGVVPIGLVANVLPQRTTKGGGMLQQSLLWTKLAGRMIFRAVAVDVPGKLIQNSSERQNDASSIKDKLQ